MGVFGKSPSVLLQLLLKSLSSEPLLGDESLDLTSLGGLLLDLPLFVTLLLLDRSLDLSPDNVLSHIVLLSESESSSDAADSLWSESSWSLRVGESSTLSLALLKNFEEKNSKIWSANETSD